MIKNYKLRGLSFHLRFILLFTIWLFSFSYSQAQERSISGTVTDPVGVPLPGVNILIKETSSGTQTDFDGNYTITVREEDVLVFSFVGMVPQEVEIAQQQEINVSLEEDSEALDEVVVVGYGTQKRSDITGSVASFDGEVLEKMPQIDVTQALQGRVAGLNVTFNGANAEGGDSNLLIRGKNSISADNNPFIVVDGIPFAGSISEINPSDIESINVLKDASATAIYGARASNGVILITTKKGEKGKARISYSSNFGFSDIANLPDMMSAETFYQTKVERFGEGSISSTEANGYAEGRDTDWVGLATRRGERQEHNLTVSGGGDKVQYYLSGTLLDSKGIAKNDDFKRYSIRLSLDTQIKPWLQIGTSTQFAHIVRDGLSANFQTAFEMNPFAIPHQEDGSIELFPWAENTFYTNPLENFNVLNDDKTRRVITSNYLQIDFPFIEGLSYRMNVGGSYRFREVNTYYDSTTLYGLQQGGVSEMDFWQEGDWTLENLIYYNREFGEHTIGLTGLYSFQERTVKNHEYEGIGFPGDTRTNFQHGSAQLITASDTYIKTANISQMFRLNYSFKERYLLTATARRDGYSGFGADEKYGVFPSMALGWNIAKESFLENIRQIKELKLRFSYGKTGNQAIGAYSTLPGLNSLHYIDNNGNTAYGYYPSSIGDSSLSWETTLSRNIGLDFRLFNNRVQGSFDYFISNTTDLLLNRNISSINGTTSIRQNIGETKNRGLELQVSSINIDTPNFRWSTDINFSRYRNEIVNVALTDEDGNYIDDIGNNWFIGEPIDVNFGYEYNGIFQEGEDIVNSPQPDALPGDVRVKDIDGNGIIDENDRTIIGSLTPDFTAGMNNTFRYKNFTLSAFVNMVSGVTKFNYLTRTFFNGEVRSYDYNFWTAENPHNYYPANREGNNSRNVTIFGKDNDASFIRLNDVTLNYTMPNEFIGELGISNLEIFFNAKNLVTITNWKGLDPEFSDQRGIPQTKTYLTGIRASF